MSTRLTGLRFVLCALSQTANEATLLGLSKPELVQMVVALRSGEKIDIASATPPPTTKRKEPAASSSADVGDLEGTPHDEDEEPADEDDDDYTLEGLGPEAMPTDAKLKQIRKDEKVRTKELSCRARTGQGLEGGVAQLQPCLRPSHAKMI